MWEFFDTSGFPARWTCGRWSSGMGWLHVLSDIAIWLAYFAIPLVLGYFILQKKNAPFRNVIWLFVAFILACGTTHLIDAIIFWWPIYPVGGLVKLFTAVVSWATVIALARIMPVALSMRTPDELEQEIGKNIRDLEEAKARLKEDDSKKDEFLAMLAHELRNPLSPIYNGLKLLAKTDDATERKPIREMMERQLMQLIRLVDDLLDLNRIKTGKVELHKEKILLCDIVNRAVESTAHSVQNGRHKLTVVMPQEPVWVYVDPVRLQQATANILHNACKYTPKGGEIRVIAERQGDSATVTIKDNGIGIPPPMLKKIFEMFEQINRSAHLSQGGMGIGLTLALRLIEMHGGTVIAYSDGQDRGAEFKISLPLAEPPSEVHKVLDESKPRRVLVVDDNIDHADSLTQMLRLMGNEVQTAYSGKEGIEKAIVFTPELVLLDIGMPEMDGFETARRMRQAGVKSTLVALTGWGQDEDRRRSKEAGFDIHLIKPLDLDRLESVLRGEAQKR